MEAEKLPEKEADPSIPHPKRFTRRDFIALAVSGGALSYAANEWLKRQDYRQGEMIRMFAMRAAPTTYDRPDQRPNLCIIDVKDIISGEDIQIKLPAARTKAETNTQDRIMSADMKRDLLVLRNVGALDGARWGQTVTDKGKLIITTVYDQVEIRPGALQKIRESAEK